MNDVPLSRRNFVITIRQVSPGVWDWQVDWTRNNRPQRSSGTSQSWEHAAERVKDEMSYLCSDKVTL